MGWIEVLTSCKLRILCDRYCTQALQIQWYRTTYSGFGARWKKIFFGPAARVELLKIFTLNQKDKRQTLSCRVSWGWSERGKFFSRHTMILTERQTNMQHSGAPVICTGSYPPYTVPRIVTEESLFVICFWHNSPQWARAALFTMFLDHTQRCTTVCRTPLDEWSICHRELYLTTHNTHNRRTFMHAVGLEPTFPASERQKTYALDCAVLGSTLVRVPHEKNFAAASFDSFPRLSLTLITPFYAV